MRTYCALDAYLLRIIYSYAAYDADVYMVSDRLGYQPTSHRPPIDFQNGGDTLKYRPKLQAGPTSLGGEAVKIVDIHEAKAQLSSLVEKAANGEAFIVTKAGKPMVKVSPYKEIPAAPRIGFMKGKLTIPEDFDSMGTTDISERFGSG